MNSLSQSDSPLEPHLLPPFLPSFLYSPLLSLQGHMGAQVQPPDLVALEGWGSIRATIQVLQQAGSHCALSDHSRWSEIHASGLNVVGSCIHEMTAGFLAVVGSGKVNGTTCVRNFSKPNSSEPRHGRRLESGSKAMPRCKLCNRRVREGCLWRSSVCLGGKVQSKVMRDLAVECFRPGETGTHCIHPFRPALPPVLLSGRSW